MTSYERIFKNEDYASFVHLSSSYAPFMLLVAHFHTA